MNIRPHLPSSVHTGRTYLFPVWQPTLCIYNNCPPDGEFSDKGTYTYIIQHIWTLYRFNDVLDNGGRDWARIYDCDNVFDSYFCHCLCNIWPSCILYVVASNLVFASGSEFVTTHPVGLLLFALLHAFRGGSRFLLFIYIFFSHACVRVLRTVYGTEIEPETESVNKNKKYIHAPAMAALLKNSIGILFICWLWNFPQDFPIMKWGLPRCWIGER